MEQNEQLEAENAELRQQIVDYDRIKAENEAYKALARIQDSNTEASYISAFVIGRDRWMSSEALRWTAAR